jgi:hypothetical protein
MTYWCWKSVIKQSANQCEVWGSYAEVFWNVTAWHRSQQISPKRL